MNKNELVAIVAERAGMTKAEAGRAVDALFDSIRDGLRSGDDIKIIGFGNFGVAERAARMGRDPRTGSPISIGPSSTPKFRAGKALKLAINGDPVIDSFKEGVDAEALAGDPVIDS